MESIALTRATGVVNEATIERTDNVHDIYAAGKCDVLDLQAHLSSSMFFACAP